MQPIQIIYYPQPQSPIRVFGIETSKTELKDLLKAWIVISLAFTIVNLRGEVSGISAVSLISILAVFIFSSLTVGVAFLLHEMDHKFVAQHYGCFAEFRADTQMLFIALISSFLGFIFAAPGAVMILGYVDRKRNGLISASGPGTNLILAVFSLAVTSVSPSGTLPWILGVYGFYINSWIALFNMIPFGNMDGAKILRWNKPVYAFMVVTALVFVFFF